MIVIRPATYEDLHVVADIHVTSWKETYVGKVPQDYLDGLNVADRQCAWEEIFQGKTAEDKNLDIAYLNDNPVGFVSFGRGRDEGFKSSGEIYAVYLLKESQGKSVGYHLFQSAKTKLMKMGFSKAYLWVLDTNTQAIQAYQKWGGQIINDKEKFAQIGNQKIREIMISFQL